MLHNEIILVQEELTQIEIRLEDHRLLHIIEEVQFPQILLIQDLHAHVVAPLRGRIHIHPLHKEVIRTLHQGAVHNHLVEVQQEAREHQVREVLHGDKSKYMKK
jgi:hypothetical protein